MPTRRPSLRAAARALALATGLVWAGATALAGQVTEGPLSPAGRLRVEASASFFHWSERFGLRDENGALVEEVEPLGFDLERDDATTLFPGVALLEERTRALLGDDAFQGAVGSSRARIARDVTRVPLRLDLGVFDWLTVGVTVPLVKRRTEVAFALRPDADGNLGVSPTVSAASALEAFLDALGSRAVAAGARASSLCAAGDPGCADAEALAAEAGTLASGLRAAYGASPLFLTAGSAAGGALRARVDALGLRLESAGLGGLPGPVPLAATSLDADGFDLLFRDPRGGLQAPPLGDVTSLWGLGDVELAAAVRLLEGTVRDSAGAPARGRWQVGARALVRLGTGRADSADVFFDLGTGDGQTDVEVGGFANGRLGSLGMWADVRYGMQSPVTRLRRVVGPDVVLAPVATRAAVRWTPGDYLQVELSPRWHLTPELAVAGTWRSYRKGEDAYEALGMAPDGGTLPDPSLLAGETEVSLHEVGAGLVYSTMEAWREGRTRAPLEVRFGVQAGVAGSGGGTPKGVRLQTGLRLYRSLWGN